MERTMRVVLCDPGKLAQITEIGRSLAQLQEAVGGLIEVVAPYDDDVCIICCEEGKINGSDPNRALYGDDGEIVDIVFGNFFLCGSGEESFESLSEEQLQQYLEKFRYPEMCFRCEDGIRAEKYLPWEVE